MRTWVSVVSLKSVSALAGAKGSGGTVSAKESRLPTAARVISVMVLLIIVKVSF